MMKTAFLIRFLKASLAAVFGLVAAAVFYKACPQQFNHKVGVIGFPSFDAFHIDGVFYQYYALILVFPLVALLSHAFLNRRSFFVKGKTKKAPAPDFQTRLGLIFFNGLALSFLAYPWFAKQGSAVTWILTIGALYTTVHFFLPKPISFRLNIFATPLAFFSLYAVSKHSVAEWFPLGVCLPLILIGYAWIYWGLSRQKELEVDAVFAISGSVLAYLFYESFPSSVDFVFGDMFHNGESLVAAQLLDKGLFPWRDSVPIHGLVADTFRSWVGFAAFERSVWGSTAGLSVILMPLSRVLFYLCNLFLLRPHRWLALALSFFLPLLSWKLFQFGLVIPRFIFHPVAILSLLAFFRFEKIWLGIVAGVVLFFTVVLCPEDTYLLAVFFGVSLAKDLLERKILRGAFFRLGLGFAGALAVWCLFLWSHNSLADFFQYYTNFASGHRYTGGIPIRWKGYYFNFAGIVPGIYLLSCWAIAYGLIRRRRLPDIDEWMLCALGIFSFLYESKFLSRGDMHVFQPFLMSLPLGFLLLKHLLDKMKWGTYVGMGLALALTVFAAKPMAGEANHLFEKNNYPKEQKAFPIADTVDDLQRFLNTYLTKGETLFDFTNQGALFHYFADRLPSTKYPYIIMANHQGVQHDLIRQLEEKKPKLVVFESTRGFYWDGIFNDVRHFVVAEYLLRNYEPFAVVRGNYFLKRKGEILKDPSLLKGFHQPIEKLDRLFAYTRCYWRFIPNFIPHMGEAVGVTQWQEIKTKTNSDYWTQTEVLLDPGLRKDVRALKISFKNAKTGFVGLTDDPLPESLEGISKFIGVESLDRNPEPIVIPVGSCVQWYNFGKRLFLHHERDHEIEKVWVGF